MLTRPLGTAGCEVSRLSLGSWRTFERITRDEGLAVMRAARDSGITFLDDARYNDETGKAPIATGYSEVVFGELFRAAGWRRQDTVVANKLWWEWWPEQTPAEELEGSLGRMGLDHVDLIYTEQPPAGYPLDEFLGSVAALITAGKARWWGVLNWPADLVIEASQVAEREGLPPMVANQLAYSLVSRSPVEDSDMVGALGACGASVVASYVLAGGVLTGKYAAGATSPQASKGRAVGLLDDPRVAPAVRASRQLVALGRTLSADPAALAIAFALMNPMVATVLFGATRPEQVRDNVAALELAGRLDQDIAALQAIRATKAT
jgi:aryl-alcohol dehydrogenase-like predicted oxidoreductase